MNREIKFRWYLKRKNDVTTVEFTLEQLEIKVQDWIYDNGFTREDIIARVQYTGLKDKNGVEIYEGDVISVCNGSINGVHWMQEPYDVRYKPNKGFDICMFCWDANGESDMDSTHWCEVIGNIYQNPELIKAA